MKKAGFWLGVIAFIVIALIPAPDGLSREAWITLALLALMVCWWVSEALPIGVTSLLPIVIAPLFGLSTVQEAAAPFAHHIIFLLMGGFIIGKSIERWNLHERIALNILARIGSHPASLIAGFMITAALLSMWISNTATVIMLVPIILSLAASAGYAGEEKVRFTLAALLGTAWAASIGGLGTPVGTTPNLIIISFLEEAGDTRFGFVGWMKVGLPTVLIMLPAALLVVTKWGPKLPQHAPDGATTLFRDKLAKLGAMTAPERRVAFTFLTVALFWMFRRVLQDIDIMGAQPLAGLSDSLIAIAGVIALFAIPAGCQHDRPARLLDWPTAAKIPWDILLLFGGGLSLAFLIRTTGLSVWLGSEMSFITALPPILMTLVLVTFVIFFTELTSNTATTAALMPIVAAIALETGIDPAQLALPIGMAASCAFMLPMATGPNAVIFGSGEVSMAQMARAGFKLNLLGILLITGLMQVVMSWVV